MRTGWPEERTSKATPVWLPAWAFSALVDPLTAGRAVVHVLQFQTWVRVSVVVREHQSGLARPAVPS